MINSQPTTITQKGQVTIPVEIRKLLHLKSGDQVKFIANKNNEITIKPSKRFSIMSLYGSLKPKIKSNLTGQELIKWESEMAHRAWAKEANK